MLASTRLVLLSSFTLSQTRSALTLLLQGERCVCELMDELDLAQSRLSWHLKTLSDAGIIVGRREGRWNYYSLNADVLAEAREILDMLKPGRRLSVRSSCCD